MIPAQTTIQVGGMKSGQCADTVRQALEALPGVFAVEVSLQAGEASVTYDTAMVPEQALQGVIEAAGYTITPEEG